MSGFASWATFARILAWFAALIAITAAVASFVTGVGVALVDLGSSEPLATPAARLLELVVFTLAIPFVCVTQALVIFTLPHLFQATVSQVAAIFWRTPAYVTTLVVLPLTALVTFYSYAHFIVPVHNTLSGEDAPYPHELTAITYLLALAAQIPETMFTAAYASAMSGRLRPTTVIRFSIGLAVVAGG